MARMSKNDQKLISMYESRITDLEKMLEDLRSELKESRTQNYNLQNAILAIQAPQAYADMRYDQIPQSEKDPDLVEKNKKINGIRDRWIAQLEEPVFKTTDDMMRMLGGVIASGGIEAQKSLHGNDES